MAPITCPFTRVGCRRRPLCKFTPKLVFKFLQRSLFGPPKFIKTTFLKDIRTLIEEYTINQFLLTRCQMKQYEQGYDIISDFVWNQIVFRKRRAVKNQVAFVLWSTVGSRKIETVKLGCIHNRGRIWCKMSIWKIRYSWQHINESKLLHMYVMHQFLAASCSRLTKYFWKTV